MKLPEAVRRQFQRWGKAGGKKGGPARAVSLSPERRREIARNAALARHRKNGG